MTTSIDFQDALEAFLASATFGTVVHDDLAQRPSTPRVITLTQDGSFTVYSRYSHCGFSEISELGLCACAMRLVYPLAIHAQEKNAPLFRPLPIRGLRERRIMSGWISGGPVGMYTPPPFKRLQNTITRYLRLQSRYTESNLSRKND